MSRPTDNGALTRMMDQRFSPRNFLREGQGRCGDAHEIDATKRTPRNIIYNSLHDLRLTTSVNLNILLKILGDEDWRNDILPPSCREFLAPSSTPIAPFANSQHQLTQTPFREFPSTFRESPSTFSPNTNTQSLHHQRLSRIPHSINNLLQSPSTKSKYNIENCPQPANQLQPPCNDNEESIPIPVPLITTTSQSDLLQYRHTEFLQFP